MTPEFLFEIRDQILAHILAPVIELESVGTVLGYGIFGAAAVVAAAAGSGKQHGTSQHHGNQFFHAFVLLFSLIIGTTFTMISTTVISAMTRVDRALMDWIHTLAHGVDQNGYIVYTIAGDKVGNYKVIEAHGESNQRAGNDTRHDLRHNDLGQGLQRSSTQIQGGIGEVGVQGPQLRGDRQDHIGGTEHDMGQPAW